MREGCGGGDGAVRTQEHHEAGAAQVGGMWVCGGGGWGVSVWVKGG